MATNNARILVAQMARVWLAPVGTVAPADPVIAMPTGWKDVGLFTPDSLSFSTDPNFEEVRSHQSNYATRRFQTEDAASAEVDLQEWSLDNFKAIFGGGTVTPITVAGPPAKTYYRYAPPAIGGRADIAACLEIIDGIKTVRRMLPRCTQIEGASSTFNKTSESTLPLRLAVIGSDIGDPWYDLIDDVAFSGV